VDLALVRYARLTNERVTYVLKELEEKHPPVLRHAKGCKAAEDDSQQCLPKCPDRELRATLTCIRSQLHDLLETAPARKFGKDQPYSFPSRDAYMALVVEVEVLRERVAELDPAPKRIGAPEIVEATVETSATAQLPEK